MLFTAKENAFTCLYFKIQQNKTKLIRYKTTIFMYIFIETITYKPQLQCKMHIIYVYLT